MKTLLRAALAALAALVLALLVNTFRRLPARRGAPLRDPADAIDERAVAEHLSRAIQFRTVSHQDPKDDDRSVFAALRAFLESTYPRVHATLQHETVNGDGLVYRWDGSEAHAQPVLFMAHQDVVPVEPGTESQWSHPPFDGIIADGFVWGRGAIDDKGSLVCLFEALESLVAEGWKPARPVWLVSGFDEEVGGAEGARKIAELLARRDAGFAWVLDEGSAVARGVIAGVERPVASIAVSEKGYLSVELIARTEGGHSSMPPAETAVGVLAVALDRLQKNQFDSKLTPTLERTLETLAPEMPFGQRVALSNLWLTAPLVLRGLASQKETAPLVRTTTAPTILEAGVKDNVLPSTARAVVNFRLLPGDSVEDALAHVRDAVADARIQVNKLERTISEAAPLSSTTGPGFRAIARVVGELFPDAVVVPGVVNGATDSRHFQRLAGDVYRFMPFSLHKTDLRRVHGTDERVGLADLAKAVRAYRRILQVGAGPASEEPH